MVVVHSYDMDRLCCVWLILVVCFHNVLSQCKEEKTIPVGMERVTVRFPPTNQTTYEKFLFCEWRFVAENPDMRIVYQISNASVPCEDTLEVYAADTPNKETVCCNDCPNNGPVTKPVSVTPARELRIDFNSDGTTHDYEKGFEVNLVASKRHEYCPVDPKPIQVTSEKQQIASPNFPDIYDANLDCRYELTAPTGVIVKFQYIDVEVHKECENSCCDVLNIYQGAIGTGNQPIASICTLQNFKYDQIFESVGTTLTLQLVTDAVGPFRGFVATVQAKEGGPTTLPITTTLTTTTTEQSIEVLETLQYSRFELRCKIPTLENGVDITWTKDGTLFHTVDNNRYYFLEDNTLVVFMSILQEDSGVYVCEANDPFSSTYSARIVVNDRGLRCTEDTCNGNGTCVDNADSYICNCFQGYEGTHCEKDKDECEEPDICARGSCINTVGSYYCDCLTSPGWTGPSCEQDINECESNETNACPQNSACVNNVGSYECSCNKGWSGPTCEIDIDECNSMPCSRNEVCENTPGTYQCTCKKGWTGLKCAVDIDECNSMPCSRNEVCENSPGTYQCTCKKGWTGLKCAVDIDECKINSSICGQNGVCVNVKGSYSCKCNNGWTGSDCNTDINECENITSACSGNGRCLNNEGSFTCVCNSGWEGPRCSVKVELTCIQIPCKNNGSCILNTKSQKNQCICQDGFEGGYCEKDINECVTKRRPCSGRGSCVNSFGSYFCNCFGDWEGLRCEKRIDPCLSNPCPKNSLCKMKGSSYECTCIIGWEGPNCDQEVKKATGPCADMCRGTESCYLEHDCTHYKHCYARNFACHCTLMKCAFGTFWSSSLNTCDKVSNVLCKSDPCLTLPTDSTYPSEFNCRTFYMCNKNMQSIAMCCNWGYAYDHDVKNCTRNQYCNIECSTQSVLTTTMAPTSPRDTLEFCKLRPFIGDSSKFINSGIVQECAKGTRFQLSICGCGGDKDFKQSQCSPLVYIDFGDKIRDVNQQSYVEVKDVLRRNSAEPIDVYGFFNGRSSSIRIPRFSAVALRLLTIQLRFYALPSGPRYQVLVSNCRSSAKSTGIIELQNQTPSVAIVADTKDEHLTLLGYSEDWKVRPAILTLSYKANAWMNVELLYNGRSLAGRVRSFNSNGSIWFESEDETVLSGNLVAPDGPLSIGMCKENQDSFYGFMDMVQVFDCNP